MKTPVTRSIRTRLIALTVGVATLGIVANATAVVLLYRDAARESARGDTHVLAATVAEYVVGPVVFDDAEGAQSILAGLASNPTVKYAVVRMPDGAALAHYGTEPARGSPALLRADQAIRHEGRDIATLSLLVSSEKLESELFAQTLWVLAIAGALALLCVIVAFRAGTSLTDPILRLSATMERIGESGTLSARVTHTRDDEVGVLYRRFNDMLDDLEQRGRERDQLEDQLRQAQKMEALGQLAGGIAHDFNNLLAGVQGFAELLRMRLPPGRDRDAAESILLTGKRAASLVSRLLAFSHQSSARMEPTSMNELVQQVLDILEHTVDRRIELRTDLDADPCLVSADPSELQSALLNLGLNARDAMPEGGMLELSTRRLTLSPEQLAAHGGELEPGPYVELCVRDTGSGIPEAIQGRVFEPFFTTKKKGTGSGLGLSAVYATVKGHGGMLELDSREGEGTTFRLRLPCATGTLADAEGAAASDAQDVAAAPARGSGRVLIIDDEESLLVSGKHLLEALGYDVATADCGEAGLSCYFASDPPFDLVMLDLVMPGMSGSETARALRARDPHATILAVSGYSGAGDAEALQADGYLAKPYELPELARKLEELMKLSRARRGPRPKRSAPTAN